MKTFHTSANELADIATRARAKTLVTTHVAFMSGATQEDLIAALKKGYGGTVVVAHGSRRRQPLTLLWPSRLASFFHASDEHRHSAC